MIWTVVCGTMAWVTWVWYDVCCRFGDKLDFNIGEQRRPGGPVRMAVNVRLVLRNLTGRCQGFIATLKDNYGFIENVDHDKEVFFHFR